MFIVCSEGGYCSWGLELGGGLILRPVCVSRFLLTPQVTVLLDRDHYISLGRTVLRKRDFLFRASRGILNAAVTATNNSASHQHCLELAFVASNPPSRHSPFHLSPYIRWISVCCRLLWVSLTRGLLLTLPRLITAYLTRCRSRAYSMCRHLLALTGLIDVLPIPYRLRECSTCKPRR